MQFPKKYKCLKNQSFEIENYKIVPIRYKDRFKIMKWRNEQIYHLRQSKKLTKKNQDLYFDKILKKSLNETKPKQILFSFLHNDLMVAYGGLVHINWMDVNAEISFVIDTNLEKTKFNEYWSKFLYLIQKVSFNELLLAKIYTFAFDIRPAIYDVLLDASFVQEARLRNHVIITNKLKDVLVHSKLNPKYEKYKR